MPKYELELDIFTPVHIGNGNDYMPFIEGAWEDGHFCIYDMEKLFEGLGGDQSAIGTWTAAIEIYNTRNPKNNRNFNGLINKAKANVTEIYSQKIPFVTRERNKTIKQQIRNGFGVPYIPGSSIKGAIRTAIFGTLFKSSYFDNNAKLLRESRGFTSKNLEKHLFVNQANGATDANHDMFRFLTVGDCELQKTKIYGGASLNLKNEVFEQDDRLKVNWESLSAGQTGRFYLSIDKERFSSYAKKMNFNNPKFFPFDDRQGLFKLINKHTKQQIQTDLQYLAPLQKDDFAINYEKKLKDCLDEVNYFSSEGENEFCMLRLGQGIGHQWMTGGWLQKDDKVIDDDLYENLSKAIRKKQGYENYYISKTRRYTGCGEPFGFVVLAIPESE